MTTRVAIIIPCYNEEKTIAGLLGQIDEHYASSISYNITPIVVNDCSTDNTVEQALSKPCILLNLPVNLGIGGAVQTGFKYAHMHAFDIAIQIDGDGQHPIECIPEMIAPVMSNEADVVIGSRFINGEGFQSTRLRRVGIRYFQWLNHLITGKKITDNTSGLRAINAKVLKIVSEFYPDDFPEPVAIPVFSHFQFRIKEIPVIMRERQGGESSITAWKSVYYMIKVTLSIMFVLLKLRKWKT
jgi:glycosyltransferase involved in cell wall biosynthesis